MLLFMLNSESKSNLLKMDELYNTSSAYVHCIFVIHHSKNAWEFSVFHGIELETLLKLYILQ